MKTIKYFNHTLYLRHIRDTKGNLFFQIEYFYKEGDIHIICAIIRKIKYKMRHTKVSTLTHKSKTKKRKKHKRVSNQNNNNIVESQSPLVCLLFCP